MTIIEKCESKGMGNLKRQGLKNKEEASNNLKNSSKMKILKKCDNFFFSDYPLGYF